MGMACGGFMWAADLQSLHKHKYRNGALFWEGGGSGMAPQESIGLSVFHARDHSKPTGQPSASLPSCISELLGSSLEEISLVQAILVHAAA